MKTTHTNWRDKSGLLFFHRHTMWLSQHNILVSWRFAFCFAFRRENTVHEEDDMLLRLRDTPLFNCSVCEFVWCLWGSACSTVPPRPRQWRRPSFCVQGHSSQPPASRLQQTKKQNKTLIYARCHSSLVVLDATRWQSVVYARWHKVRNIPLQSKQIPCATTAVRKMRNGSVR